MTRALLAVGLWVTTAGTAKAGPEDARLLPLKIRVGEKAPEFDLLSAKGERVRLSDFVGHNVLIDLYRGFW